MAVCSGEGQIHAVSRFQIARRERCTSNVPQGGRGALAPQARPRGGASLCPSVGSLDCCAFHGCRWSPGWGSAEALAQSGRGSSRDRRQHRPRPPQLPLGLRRLPPVRHTMRRRERVKTHPLVGTRRVPPRRRMVTTQLPRLRWRPPLAQRTAFFRPRIRTTTITASVPCAMRLSGGLPVLKPTCFFAKANSTSRTGSWRSARGGRSSRSISLRCESDLANWGAASIREGSHSGC